LRTALDEIKGTVEIADEGPFLVNDLRIPGESRVIRARDGFRPIIRIERPVLEVVRALPGVINLDARSLVLDSLDLVVNLRDLSPSQTCLFSCVGANLTVRNCTITVINPASLPFTLVRALGADARGCRLRFEKTLIRGSMALGFELGRGAADVVFRDTVLLGSQGPVVRSLGAGQASEHRFAALDSITACRGPAIELHQVGAGAAAKPRPIVIRAFNSVFGRFQGAGIASVIASGSSPAVPREYVDWLGDRNLFCGWKGFYAAGAESTIVISSLAAHRSTWNGSDGNSQEIPVSWPQPQYLGHTESREWLPFVPGREAILGRVASPRPFLAAKTTWSFPSPLVPVPVVLATAAQEPSRATVREPQAFRDRMLRKELFPRAELDQPGDHGGPQGAVPELFFDAESTDWHGDLGAFLRDKIKDRGKHVRIRVRGSGPRHCSPVRLPDDVVLQIRVEPPLSEGADWLSWSPEPESTGQALLELHGGSLVLSGVRLRVEPSAAVESLVRVEEGDLILHRCQLIASPGSESKMRQFLSFSVTSTRPRTQPPPGLFMVTPDRSVCIIGESTMISSGSVLRAEIARGLVALFQTAIAAPGDLIELVPARVARARFEADLVLDRCTLASESNIIRLRAWQGRDLGPDRPWLINSNQCAYLGTYDRRVSDTVLFRTEPEAMAHGLGFWQGAGDAVEVDGFAAVGDGPPSVRSRDVTIQWVNFWGSNHQRGITGPRTGSNLPSVRLLDRLKAGRVEPSDLILEPNYHPGRSQLDVGADLSRQGIHPRPSPGGRRR
jgi:serine/threonine-protein kinase